MKNIPSWLPVVSLVIAGLTSLAFLAANVVPSENRRALVFVVCLGDLVSLVLGVVGFASSREEAFNHRVPAVIAAVLGGSVFVWSALVAWLSTPF